MLKELLNTSIRTLKTADKYLLFCEDLFRRILWQNKYFYPYQCEPLIIDSLHIQEKGRPGLGKDPYDAPFDGHILWAAPKSRRSIEKRRSIRIGAMNYVCKLIPLKKLQTCLMCGHAHEVGRLCPNCYSKVQKVTEEIKVAMKKAYGRQPIEHDFIPSFKGENVSSKDGFYEGKRILEVPIERPSWFSKNLLQKSNVMLSEETTPGFPNPMHIKSQDDS